MKHTENGIKYHKLSTGCKGQFTKAISDKGDMGAFEIFTCDGTHAKGRGKGKPCNYAGRGAQIRVGPAIVEELEDPNAEDYGCQDENGMESLNPWPMPESDSPE